MVTLIKNSILFVLMLTSLDAAVPWWNSDWHYRVPLTISSAVSQQTGKLNVDFTTLGLPGDLDENSIRIVKEDGTLLAQQEFTDILYNDATDELNDGQGEIKFILEEEGDVTYYLYYDNVDHGNKSVLDSTYVINGNFEHSNGSTPTGWSTGSANIGSNAPNNEVHHQSSEGETVSVTDDGGTDDTETVNNTARTGDAFHLHGYRDRQESDSKKEQVWIEKTLDVPTSSSGNFSYWFRIQGWDQATSNTAYDRFRVYVNGNIIDPNTLSINNSDIAIYSEVYGKDASYRRFGDLGWTQARLDLSAYAGSNIVIRIEQESYGDNGYKAWQLIDDVEWSLNTTIGLGDQEEAPIAKLSMTKDSCVLEDPINGTTNPKRIPGATIRYSIEIRNAGGAEASAVVVTDNLNSSFDYGTIRNLQIQDGVCDCLGTSAASNNGSSGSANGENPVKLDFETLAEGTDSTPEIECGYFEVRLK